MIRSQGKVLRFKAEITVLLSLIFLLMISVITALFTSASVQAKKSGARAKMTLALESVFAEYDKDLLDRYDIFARAESEEGKIIRRLQYYGITDTEHSLKKAEYLTDNHGLPYYQQAVRYVKNWLGMDESMSGSESDFLSDDSLKEMENQTEKNLSEMLSEDENSLLEDKNPLSNIQSLKKSNLLSILVSDKEKISQKKIDVKDLPSKRTLNKGTGGFKESNKEGGYTDKIWFTTYLMEHFSDASQKKTQNVLTYELEYILGGKEKDSDNLEFVLRKILNIRWALNYSYLLTDAEKKAEAEALALVLCSLLTVPGVTKVVKQAILLAWAYGESIVDLRVLMKQEKVPAVKTAKTWQLKLSNLAKLGTKEEISGAKSSKTGLSYSDYVKGLLLLESRKNLCMRSLDLIESNLEIQTDLCITGAEISSSYQLRGSVWDAFQTIYQYQ